MLDALPGHVESAIPGDEVADQGLQNIVIVQGRGLDESCVGEEQIDCEATRDSGEHLAIERAEVGRVGYVPGRERLPLNAICEQNTADMSEAVTLAGVEPG